VFHVVEKLCTHFDDECVWSNKSGKITARSDAPPDPWLDKVPSLGVGFTDQQSDLAVLNFSCNGDGSPAGGTLLNINPRDYNLATDPTITVTLTYQKSETGNGAASSFTFCMSKTNGATWDAVTPCAPTPVPPCVLEQKRVTGGGLSIILFIEADDPWGGLS
ncbi:MAG TPA: hypothetical protein VEW90_07955, partial [Gaiellaceae bacterium]|nr:hypothetical protein [Gaiellaceae bacterium]